MKNYKFVFYILLLTGCCVSSLFAQTVVVVNPKSTLTDISQKDLKHLFLGNLSKLEEHIELHLMALDSLKEDFYHKVTGKSSKKIAKLWISKKITGATEVKPPEDYSSGAEIKSAIGSNVGAIGFMDLKDVDESVKVLTIDGKKPGDKDYLLDD